MLFSAAIFQTFVLDANAYFASAHARDMSVKRKKKGSISLKRKIFFFSYCDYIHKHKYLMVCNPPPHSESIVTQNTKLEHVVNIAVTAAKFSQKFDT